MAIVINISYDEDINDTWYFGMHLFQGLTHFFHNLVSTFHSWLVSLVLLLTPLPPCMAMVELAERQHQPVSFKPGEILKHYLHKPFSARFSWDDKHIWFSELGRSECWVFGRDFQGCFLEIFTTIAGAWLLFYRTTDHYLFCKMQFCLLSYRCALEKLADWCQKIYDHPLIDRQNDTRN